MQCRLSYGGPDICGSLRVQGLSFFFLASDISDFLWGVGQWGPQGTDPALACLLYTSDAADDLLCVDLGGRRIIKKKNH